MIHYMEKFRIESVLVLVRIGHAINSSPSRLEESISLFLSLASGGHIQAFRDSCTFANLIGPLLQVWKFGQINFQESGPSTDP